MVRYSTAVLQNFTKIYIVHHQNTEIGNYLSKLLLHLKHKNKLFPYRVVKRIRKQYSLCKPTRLKSALMLYEYPGD